MGAGMSTDADPAKLTDGLGTRWTLAETSFKFHASCRHTHPAADALLKAMRDNGLGISDIGGVTTLVHQGAIVVLGPVVEPASVHQAKFSMGTTLGLIAAYGRAGMREFEERFASPEVAGFRDRVSMVLDDEVDTAYPARWIGKVVVETVDGRRFEARVDEPKGDPGNTLSRDEIDGKVRGLAAFSGAAAADEMDAVLPRLWEIGHASSIGSLMPAPARAGRSRAATDAGTRQDVP